LKIHGSKIGFVFSRKKAQKRSKLLVFTYQIIAYVYFTYFEIGFVFHSLPHDMVAFAYLIGVNLFSFHCHPEL